MTIKTPIADQLGLKLAEKANLGDVIDAFKATLIEMSANTAERAFEGELFRATVTFGTKTVVDYKAVLAALVEHTPSFKILVERLVEEHTRTAEGVPTVRCAARKA